MNLDRIMMVDRQDQAEWLVSPSWPSFRLSVKGNKSAIFNWLMESSTGRVVISGEGKLPEEHKPYKIWETYDDIQKDIYKIYFEDGGSAALFKLAWGGNI